MIKFIFLVAHIWVAPDFSSASDSLRLETVGGKTFVIHQVDEQETLYGISRRYGASITQILEYNKEADAGLDVGQILRIPYVPRTTVVQSSKDAHTVAPGETLFSISRLYNLSVDELKSMNNLTVNALSVGQQLRIKNGGSTTTSVTVQPDVRATTVVGYHSVAPQETLYSISREYGVTVQQIKEWNNMTGSNLEIGQLVRIAAPGTQPSVVTTVDSTVKTTVPPVIKQPLETVVKISENVAGTDEIKESGLAELIDGTEGNRKYLALHRSAKPGTILKVRNELNNREVFVRVVGPLPATSVNDKIIIKISKSAFDRLGGVDSKFRAEITYYK
ncbi:MAG: LysM peptidoglycan-binding domain-containing protein [Cyclobacteriaceae bacterium]